MAFYKYNDNRNDAPNLIKAAIHFSISNSAYNKSNVVVSISTSVTLFVFFISKFSVTLEKSDMQAISQITAGISSLALAIPLFLKDFDRKSNSWKHFFFIATVFVVTTVLGIFSFLQIDSTSKAPIQFYLILFLISTVSLNINTLVIINKRNKKTNSSNFEFNFNATRNFVIAFLLLLVSSILVSSFNLITIFFTSSIYGFYLLLVLMVAIIIEISSKEITFEDKLKKAIEELSDEYKHITLSEEQLVYLLRKEKFLQEQEQISKTKILELVSKMDYETEETQPKISIYDYNFIIPRWKPEYDEILMNSYPRIISKSDSYDRKLSIYDFDKFELEKIHRLISENSKLSIELLKYNNAIRQKFDSFFLVEYNSINYIIGSQSYYNNIKVEIQNYEDVFDQVFSEVEILKLLPEYPDNTIKSIINRCVGRYSFSDYGLTSEYFMDFLISKLTDKFHNLELKNKIGSIDGVDWYIL